MPPSPLPLTDALALLVDPAASHDPGSLKRAAVAVLVAMQSPTATLHGHLAALDARLATADPIAASSLRRAVALQASRYTDPDAIAVLERHDAVRAMLEIDRHPMPEATLRYVVDHLLRDGSPLALSQLAHYLHDAARFGSDIGFARETLLALLGRKAEGRGRQRVDVSASATNPLVRLCRHPDVGPGLVASLETLSQGRGKRAADALEVLVEHRVWTGDFVRVDQHLAAPKLTAPVAAGFGAGVYNRIFFGELGDKTPDLAWQDAVSQRFDDVMARAPKAALRILKLADGQRARLARARARAAGHAGAKGAGESTGRR
jgi:hypothetical protein